jgi:hypothetical protein
MTASFAAIVVLLARALGLYPSFAGRSSVKPESEQVLDLSGARAMGFRPRVMMDSSGMIALTSDLTPWKPDSTLEEVSNSWRGAAKRSIEKVDKRLAESNLPELVRISLILKKASLLNSDGETEKSYRLLGELRSSIERDKNVALPALFSVIHLQAVTGLRRGENENCIMCRGDSSCILPIVPAAVHTNPTGSRLAIKHFTEYLSAFPEDLEVRWLLNLAHMTLGEYPDQVDPRFRLDLSRFFHSEFDIGRFRDIGHLVGVNRFNEAGDAIMEDFDNDGLLDLAVSAWDATQSMSIYRNKGDGTFEDRTEQAGVTDQLGGLICYQTDFDNDGWKDIFIVRAAWLPFPVRPSLLRNNGKGSFIDVTKESGLLDPLNSNAAGWADYDNDGWLDLFIACEKQPSRLYHNNRNGTFEEVAARAGVQGQIADFSKGCTWIDYDNDGYPDLFVNNLAGTGLLYHNNRDGTFADVSISMGIDGPRGGFSCWAWDYDNDGWLDIFATSYDRTLEDVVKGILGQPHRRNSNRLFHNRNGQSFEDVTREAGLDMVFSTMGSNFADFDNDGFLDFYLGTGEPSLATLIPNRMFKNVGGARFAEITGTSGTGHLQKGHGIACGDWDRDGDVDFFLEVGGAVTGDKYHNILFQNPGQGNHYLGVKLVGQKTNRAAIGARIKVVTAGENPLTIHRHVTSGSSFGNNPLEQHIGLAKAERVALLEVHWPTSGTTQVFRDIAVNQLIEVTEFSDTYRPLKTKPIPQPE